MAFRLSAALFALLWASPALAQSVSFDMGSGSMSLQSVQLFVLLTPAQPCAGYCYDGHLFSLYGHGAFYFAAGHWRAAGPPNMMIVSLAIFSHLVCNGPGV